VIDSVAPMLKAKNLHYAGMLYFYPRDVGALWDHLKDQGPVEWKLPETDYGILEFAIRDCNGYTLSFGQDIGEASRRAPAAAD